MALSQTSHPLLARARAGAIPCALIVGAILPSPKGLSFRSLHALQCGAPAPAPAPPPRPVARRAIVVGSYGSVIEEIAIWDRSATCQGEAIAYDPEFRRGLYCKDGRWNVVNDYPATAFVVAGDYLRQSLVTVTPSHGDSRPEWADARPLSERTRAAQARSTP